MVLIVKLEKSDYAPKFTKNLITKNLQNKNISNIVVFTDSLYKSTNDKIIVIESLPSDKECVIKCKSLFPRKMFIWSNVNNLVNGNLSKYELLGNDSSFVMMKDGLVNFAIFDPNFFNTKYNTISDCLSKKRIDVSSEKLCQDFSIFVKKETQSIESSVVRVSGTKYTTPPEIVDMSKIDLVIVSVDYNDFLVLTLKNNLKYFSRITVVTSTSDVKCQQICESLNVKCVVTDKMYEGGDSFNKGKAINEGIKSLSEPDWILILDADIIITKKLDILKLERKTVYTSDRWICENYETFKKWQEGEISIEEVGKYEEDRGFGFFQLFNYKYLNIKGNKVYSESYENAASSDIRFLEMFDRKENITSSIHLGSVRSNWRGRKTEQFISDEKIKTYLKRGINIKSQIKFVGHRSGWEYAINSISELHDDKGVIFDGFLEDKFSWKYDSKIGEQGLQALEKQGILPYKKEWVGFLHNPHNMPLWFDYMNSPQEIVKRRIFKESLNKCIGIWALSEYQATWLRETLNIPISVVYHPTETNVPQFDYEKFLRNSDKKIYQIGWWLRRVNSIYQLNIDSTYRKIRLDPKTENYNIQALYDKEKKIRNLNFIDKYYDNTYLINHLSNKEYDEIYTENITFVDLYDSSANNAVIEAIARSTPILVNPLPSVREYLGDDYPFYFDSLEEAAVKALNMELILETHNYLKKSPMREKIKGEYFLDSIKNSEVFKLI